MIKLCFFVFLQMEMYSTRTLTSVAIVILGVLVYLESTGSLFDSLNNPLCTAILPQETSVGSLIK